MKSKDKTKEQLINELAGLRQRIAEMEKINAKCRRVEESEGELLRELKSIFENIPFGIVYLDSQFRIVSSNKFFNDFTGFKEGELNGELCYEIVGEYSGDPTKKGLEKICSFCKKAECFKNKRPTVIERPLGDKIIRVTTIPELNEKGDIWRFMEIVEDITERKKAEEELEKAKDELEIRVKKRTADLSLTVDFLQKEITEHNQTENALKESRNELRSMYDAITDFLTVISPDYRIISANRVVEKQFGKSLVGKVCYKTYQGRDDICPDCPTRRAIETKKPAYSFQPATKISPPVDIYAFPIIDKEGEVIAIVEHGKDITERKAAEEALQKLNKELEIRVKKRTADLTSTVKTLQREISERKYAQKQVEIYQGQLRTLISNLTTLEEKLKKRISEELHDNIGQCLALSKIKLSKLRKSNTSLDILNIEIKEILELIEQTIRFTRSLSFELANPILYQMGLNPALIWLAEEIKEKYSIDVDFVSNEKLNKLNVETSVLLFKTINELLINVIKHSKAKKAGVYLTSQGDNIQVKVEDNGIGFNTSEINNYIIEKNSLGIFKIREKIKFHRGTFDIKSRSGKGTVVTLIIPIH